MTSTRIATLSLVAAFVAVLATPPDSSFAALDDGAWVSLLPPVGRIDHATVYDPIRDRMISFGGAIASIQGNDVWALSFSSPLYWAKLPITGAMPTGRSAACVIYDPLRDRIIVFGGLQGGTLLNDVWALSLSGTPTWTQLSPLGTPPSARYEQSAVYDPVRDRMLVFGEPGSTSNELWELSLASPKWTQLTMAGGPPVARSAACMIYDPRRDRLVVFGGSVFPGVPTYDDTWVLPLATLTWSQLTPTTIPPARNHASAIYDPLRDAMVIFGGQSGNASSPNLNDTWSLPLANPTSWVPVNPAGTAPRWRHSHAAIYDPPRDRMIVFGGNHGLPFYANDVWALKLSPSPEWSQLQPDRTGPTALRNHTAILDAPRDRMVAFGGLYYDGNTVYSDRTWTLTLSGAPGDLIWTQQFPATSPPGRQGHVGIRDPVRDRMIIFGGGTTAPLAPDVWSLSLADPPTWTQLAPTGTPPSSVYECSAIYDPVRDRMLVFGGGAMTFANSNALYQLTLGASPVWTLLTTVGVPPSPRFQHSAVYDPVRDRMVVFGGFKSPGGYTNEVWSLNLSTLTWTLQTPSGTPPTVRVNCAVVYDSDRDRMIVTGGYRFDNAQVRDEYFGDTWALDFVTNAWIELHPAGFRPACTELSAVLDPARNRMVTFGGDDLYFQNSTAEVRELSWSIATAVTPRSAGALRLGPPRPNPSSGGVVVALDLAAPARVDARIYDVQGRMLRTLLSARVEAGTRELRWDAVTANGVPSLAGVYFLRVQVDDRRLERSFVILR